MSWRDPDDAVVRRAEANFYSEEGQRIRREFVRERAAEAVDLLNQALATDDPDELGELVYAADARLSGAVREILMAALS